MLVFHVTSIPAWVAGRIKRKIVVESHSKADERWNVHLQWNNHESIHAVFLWGEWEILSSHSLVSLNKRLFQTRAEHFLWLLSDEIWKKRLAGAGTGSRSLSWIPVPPVYKARAKALWRLLGSTACVISNDPSLFFLVFIWHRNSFLLHGFLLSLELKKKTKQKTTTKKK